MKVLMISGSRNPEGQTARTAGAMLEGARQAGASAEAVFLPPLRVERCRQCDQRGWGDCREKGTCVIEDEFAGLVDRLREADALVVATPVYFGDLSESLRAFTDRLRRITRHENGRRDVSGTPAVGLCVAGGGGGGAPACCVSLERTLSTSGLDVVDMVPVRRQNLEARLPRLRLAGQWLAGAPSSG
jgi:multimeric flavodoxin WrbA